jgi:hypothetical protein
MCETSATRMRTAAIRTTAIRLQTDSNRLRTDCKPTANGSDCEKTPPYSQSFLQSFCSRLALGLQSFRIRGTHAHSITHACCTQFALVLHWFSIGDVYVWCVLSPPHSIDGYPPPHTHTPAHTRWTLVSHTHAHTNHAWKTLEENVGVGGGGNECVGGCVYLYVSGVCVWVCGWQQQPNPL